MIYRSLKRKNGSIHIYPVERHTTSESPICLKDEVIRELDESREELINHVKTSIIRLHNYGHFNDVEGKNLIEKITGEVWDGQQFK